MNEKILAKVGTITITEGDVDAFLMGLGQRGMSYNNPEGRKIILNQLINNKLMLLDARRNLLEGEKEFRDRLNAMKEQLLINYASEKVLAAVKVSDDEVKEYYEAHKDELKKDESVTASHILVGTEEEALDVLAKINAGEISFEDAAEKYSSCPSKENGGSLGEFGRGQMVPEFDVAVFAMAEGEISKAPVKTQFGYHLIKCEKKSDASVIPFLEIKERLTESVYAEKQKKAYESKINQLKIAYPVDVAF